MHHSPLTKAAAAFVLTGMLGLAAVCQASAATTREVECRMLQKQLQHQLLVTHAKAIRVAEARALQAKASRLCASSRKAQGIRTFADALHLLGVRPIDPDRLRHKARNPHGVKR